MNKTFYNQRFDNVQAMRGLAAISVMLHHISCIENGAFGVDIFFCISGFIMMYVSHISTKHFFVKRIIRIVPLYYFITISALVVYFANPSVFDKTVVDFGYIIKSFLFVPFTGTGKVMPMVKVGWTLNYEMLFYVVLWVSMKISAKYRGVIASGIIILIVCLSRFFGINNSIMIEFIFGILAYYIVSNINYEKIEIKISGRVLLGIVAVCSYCFMWYIKYNDDLGDIKRFIIKGIPAFILFVCVFISTYGVPIPKPIVFIGDISYSLYLSHYFIARVFDKYFIDLPDFVAIISVAGLSIAVASVSYYLFERRLNSYLRLQFSRITE